MEVLADLVRMNGVAHLVMGEVGQGQKDGLGISNNQEAGEQSYFLASSATVVEDAHLAQITQQFGSELTAEWSQRDHETLRDHLLHRLAPHDAKS